METTKPTITNQGVRYGLILGFIQVAMMLLLYLIDKTLLVKWWVGIISLVLAIVMMVVPVKSYKKQQGNTIIFKDAFLIALITGVGSMVIYLIFTYLLYNVIDPSLSDLIKQATIDNMVAMMEKFGAGEEGVNKALEEIEKQDFSQSPSRIGMQFIWGAVADAVIALIIAAIMRTKQRPVDDIQ